MDGDRWQEVQRLFHAALERPRVERSAFLKGASRGDASLQTDVEALLVNHEASDSLFDGILDASPAPRSDAGTSEGVGAHLGNPGTIAPDTLPVGQRVGPYVLDRELGRGGMGIIYLAHDTRLDRPVALKTLHPAARLDASRRQRLEVEARAAARLVHPAVATVFSLEELDGTLWLAYEYVQGRTLREVLSDQDGPLPWPQVVGIAEQMVGGLQAAHALGIVHRDLKPENVMLTSEGRVKILDFGLAQIQSAPGDPRLTVEGTVLGTPGYMAPEQFRGRRVDFTADLFAFGVMLYELSSGLHPFEADRQEDLAARMLSETPPPLTVAGPPVDLRLNDIVRQCLHEDPAHRYATTDRLVADVEALRRAMRSTLHAPALLVPPPPSAAAVAEGEGAHGDADPTIHRWWQVHQTTVAIFHAAMLYPAWHARDAVPLGLGTPFFFGLLSATVAAVSLRLNLVFTARVHPAGLSPQRFRVGVPVRVADSIVTVGLFGLGLFAAGGHPLLAIALVVVGVASFVSASFIEPATARAAFTSHTSRPSAPSDAD